MSEKMIVMACRCWATYSEYSNEVELWAKADVPDGNEIVCEHCGHSVELYDLNKIKMLEAEIKQGNALLDALASQLYSSGFVDPGTAKADKEPE